MSEKHTGIHNFGFNCFMNSTLQCLKTLEPIRNEFTINSNDIDEKILSKLSEYNDLKSSGNTDKKDITIDINGTTKKINDELFTLYGVYYNLKSVMCKLFNNDDSDINLKSLILACRYHKKNEDLFTGNQCDAQEFLTYLLDIFDDSKKYSFNIEVPNGECTNVMDKINKGFIDKFNEKYKDNYSWVIKEFGSMIITIIRCSNEECKHFVYPIDPILMSILQIPGEKNVTIYDCLDHYFGKETLTGSEKWKCKKCGNEENNTKESRMIDFPNCLIIIIARFSQDYRSGKWRKHQQIVDAPEIINLAKYAINKDDDTKNYTYELKSVCNHVGNVNGGHYYSHCKFNNEWYKMNDESCSILNRENVIDNKAYMLFYQKSNLK